MRRGGFYGGSKQQRDPLEHDGKYGPGRDPLEVEETKNKIVPNGSAEYGRQLTIVDAILKEPGLKEEERKALLVWKTNLRAAQIKPTIHEEWLTDFWKWLLGRGKESDHKMTWWYRQSLADDPEVCAYIEAFAVKMTEFRIKLEVLRRRRPTGINESYLYFKYIVRGAPTTKTNFLEDWQHFIDEFDSARDQGQLAFWPHAAADANNRPDNLPGNAHETAPYDDLRGGKLTYHDDPDKTPTLSTNANSDDPPVPHTTDSPGNDFAPPPEPQPPLNPPNQPNKPAYKPDDDLHSPDTANDMDTGDDNDKDSNESNAEVVERLQVLIDLITIQQDENRRYREDKARRKEEKKKQPAKERDSIPVPENVPIPPEAKPDAATIAELSNRRKAMDEELKSRMDKLQEDLRSATSQLDEMRGREGAASAAATRLETQLRQTQQEIANLTAQRDQIQELKRRAEKEREELKAQFEKIIDETVEKRTAVISAQARREAEKHINDAVEVIRKQHIADARQLEAEVTKLRKQLEDAWKATSDTGLKAQAEALEQQARQASFLEKLVAELRQANLDRETAWNVMAEKLRQEYAAREEQLRVAAERKLAEIYAERRPPPEIRPQPPSMPPPMPAPLPSEDKKGPPPPPEGKKDEPSPPKEKEEEEAVPMTVGDDNEPILPEPKRDTGVPVTTEEERVEPPIRDADIKYNPIASDEPRVPLKREPPAIVVESDFRLRRALRKLEELREKRKNLGFIKVDEEMRQKVEIGKEPIIEPFDIGQENAQLQADMAEATAEAKTAEDLFDRNAEITSEDVAFVDNITQNLDAEVERLNKIAWMDWSHVGLGPEVTEHDPEVEKLRREGEQEMARLEKEKQEADEQGRIFTEKLRVERAARRLRKQRAKKMGEFLEAEADEYAKQEAEQREFENYQARRRDIEKLQEARQQAYFARLRRIREAVQVRTAAGLLDDPLLVSKEAVVARARALVTRLREMQTMDRSGPKFRRAALALRQVGFFKGMGNGTNSGQYFRTDAVTRGAAMGSFPAGAGKAKPALRVPAAEFVPRTTATAAQARAWEPVEEPATVAAPMADDEESEGTEEAVGVDEGEQGDYTEAEGVEMQLEIPRIVTEANDKQNYVPADQMLHRIKVIAKKYEITERDLGLSGVKTFKNVRAHRVAQLLENAVKNLRASIEMNEDLD